MTRPASLLRAAALAAVVVAVDQATKALVRNALDRGESASVLFGVDIVNVRNRGVAFGLFADGGALLVVVAAVALGGLLVFFVLHADRPLAWLPTGLLVGGASGNLIDRAVQGYVTDFIDLPLWPAFNVADMSITFGVLSLLYVLEGPPRRAEERAERVGGEQAEPAGD